MKRELTKVEQDALRLIKGGGPYLKIAVGVALAKELANGSTLLPISEAAQTLIRLDREGIIYTNPDGTVDTTWTMGEILQGWKEC